MIKYNYATLLISLIISTSTFTDATAKASKLEKLKTLYRKDIKQNTAKVDLLNKIANKYRKKSCDSMMFYAQKAFDESSILNYEKGKAKSLQLLGLGHHIKGETDTAITLFKKSLKKYQSLGSKKNIASLYSCLGGSSKRIDLDKGLEYLNKAINIYQQINDKVGEANMLSDIALIYKSRGNYKIAEKQFKKALKMALEGKSKPSIARINVNLGLLYSSKDNLPLALDHYYKGRKIFAEINYLSSEVYVQSVIANLLFYIDRKDEAKSEYLKIIKLYEKLGYKRDLTRVLLRLAEIEAWEKNYDSARVFLNKAKLINKKGMLIEDEYSFYHKLGNIEQHEKNYSLALSNYKKTITLANASNNPKHKSTALYNMGRVHWNMKNTSKAISYLENALKLSQDTFYPRVAKSSAEQLSIIYSSINNFKKAYIYHKTFTQLKDSLDNESNTKKLTQLEMQFKFDQEKLEHQKEQQKIEALHTEELKREKNVRNSLIGGSFLLILLVSVSLYSLIQKRKSNRTLAKQKDEISNQAKILQTTNNKLIELDNFKQGLTDMIVHDLKNPLNSIINTIADESPEVQNSQMKRSGKQMLNLVLNILDVSKYENVRMNVDKLDYSLYELSQNAVDDVEFIAKQKSIKIKNFINQSIIVKADKEIVERIFVNLLTNAIKFSPNSGIVTIESASIINNYINIKVVDNGIGINKNQLNKIFNKFEQISARESGKIRSTGLGLTFCKLAVEAHGGKIWVNSNENCGTEFSLSLPVASISDDKESIITPKKSYFSSISLNSTEKNNLMFIYDKLNSLPIYNISLINDICATIKEKNIVNEEWLSALKDSVSNCNEIEYRELVNMIN